MNPIVEWKKASENFRAAYPYNFVGMYDASFEMVQVWGFVQENYVAHGRGFDFLTSAPEDVDALTILSYGMHIMHSANVMMYALAEGETENEIVFLDEELLKIVFQNMNELIETIGEFVHG